MVLYLAIQCICYCCNQSRLKRNTKMQTQKNSICLSLRNVQIIVVWIGKTWMYYQVRIPQMKNIHSPQVIAGNKDVRKLFYQEETYTTSLSLYNFISIYCLISYVIETLCRQWFQKCSRWSSTPRVTSILNSAGSLFPLRRKTLPYKYTRHGANDTNIEFYVNFWILV